MEIPKESIRSSAYEFGPRIQNVSGSTKTVDHRLRQDIIVSLEGEEQEGLKRRAGKIVELATKAGVSEISAVNFTVTKGSLRSLEAVALTNAARDARVKAEAIADPLGLKDKLKVRFVHEESEERKSPSIHLMEFP